MFRLLQVALLFSLLLTFGCQKIDTALLGGDFDDQSAIEHDLEYATQL